MNRAAFLRAICEEPHELAHRLVFADWLDEHNETARAEFIRHQIWREGLPLAHPRARASLHRESLLLENHREAWLAELPPGLHRPRFHRGFVEEVTLTPEELIAHGESLFQKTPLLRLELRRSIDLATLLSAAEVRRRFAAALKYIEFLNFNHAYLNDVNGSLLLELPVQPRLRALHIRHHSLSPLGLETLVDSGALDSVHTLEITQPHAPGGLEALGELLASPRLRELRTLILPATRLGDELMDLLRSTPLVQQLTSLTLSHAALTPVGAAALAQLYFPQLIHLDLSFNPLGPTGMEALGQANWPALRWLNLSRTQVGNQGCSVIQNWPYVKQLQGLDLSLCQIGNAGVNALLDSEKLTEIQTLDLIYNHFDVSHADALWDRWGDAVLLTR